MKKTGSKGSVQVIKETWCKIMFGFTKKLFIELLSAYKIVNFDKPLGSNSKESIKCVSLNNQPCQSRPTLVGINYNKDFLYPYTASVSSIYINTSRTKFFFFHFNCLINFYVF